MRILNLVLLCLWVSVSSLFARIEIGTVTPESEIGACDGFVQVIIEADENTEEEGLAGPFTIRLMQNGEIITLSAMGTTEIPNVCTSSFMIEVENSYKCVTELNPCENSRPIEIEIEQSNPSCSESSDGGIELIVQGGIPDYVYSWSNGSGERQLEELSSGRYFVTVTDRCGNQATAGILLANPMFTVQITELNQPSSNNSEDGSIFIAPVGGVRPYTYRWTNSAGDFEQETQNISNLNPGFYEVTVTDANNCSTSAMATLTQNCISETPENIEIQFETTQVPISGPNLGTITATISNANGLTKYEWTGPDGLMESGTQNSNQTDIVLFKDKLGSGRYYLRVEDACFNVKVQAVVVCREIQLGEVEIDGSCTFGRNEETDIIGGKACANVGYIGGQRTNGLPVAIPVSGGNPIPDIGYVFAWKSEVDDQFYFRANVTRGGIGRFHNKACAGKNTTLAVIDQLGCTHISKYFVPEEGGEITDDNVRLIHQNNQTKTPSCFDFFSNTSEPASNIVVVVDEFCEGNKIDTKFKPLIVDISNKNPNCEFKFSYKNHEDEKIDITDEINILEQDNCVEERTCGVITWCKLLIETASGVAAIYFAGDTRQFQVSGNIILDRFPDKGNRVFCIYQVKCGDEIIYEEEELAIKVGDETITSELDKEEFADIYECRGVQKSFRGDVQPEDLLPQGIDLLAYLACLDLFEINPDQSPCVPTDFLPGGNFTNDIIAQNIKINSSQLNRIIANKQKIEKLFENRLEKQAIKPILNCYPNPFSTSITIEYQLPKITKVNVEVFDITGQLIETLLIQEKKEAGKHQLQYTPENLKSGMYFIYLRADDYLLKQKVALIR